MSVIIRLKNLPMTAGAPDVRAFFSGLKIPDGAVHIIGGDEGEVFVGFSSDEDARVAMTKNGGYIHDSEIRLLLSSKAEQNAVILARKTGSYASPGQDEFSPTSSHLPPQQQQQHHNQWPGQPANPFAARSGYDASYPPPNANIIRPDFNKSKFSSAGMRPEGGPVEMGGGPGRFEFSQPQHHQHQPQQPQQQQQQIQQHNLPSANPKPHQRQQSPPKREKDEYNEYGYQRNYQAPRSRFSAPEHVAPARAPEHSAKPTPMSSYEPPQMPQTEKFGGFRGGPPPAQPVDRNPAPMKGGDSWRDNNFSQTAPSKNDYAPPKYGSGSNSDSSSSRNKDNQNSTFAPSNSGPPAVRPFQNGPPMRNGGPAPFQNPSNNFNRGAPQPPVNPSIRPFAAGPVPPMKPALPVASTEKFYIELTRLPNDLLRPAALEAFIHPSIPLTLSSAKTVFGPGGVHMHTIIRLDAISDYAMMMRRNGEQGIKIRQSDKKAFDTAEDGAPIPVPMFTVAPALKSSKKDDEPRRRSRWTEKSPPQKDKENPRRRTRSRSPHRKRRRSRSPKRREQHTDPTRWCIQVTNVPFRMKDEDLLDWFSEKVKPAKLTRTFYSDGNASDRWVAEFSSESLMRRAFSIRSLCQGRTIKLLYIDNEKADEILRIEDVYGLEKKHINEEARFLQEEAEKANPPSFFNAPTLMPRGGPLPPLPPPQGVPPMRGGFAPRGGAHNTFAPPRGGGAAGPRGPAQPFFQNGPSAFQNSGASEAFRGAFGGGAPSFRGGRGGHPVRGGGFPPGPAFRDEPVPMQHQQHQPQRNDLSELINSIGPRGTVLSCNGFPRDVTLEDVVDFFGSYDPDRNSIRIRRGEDGVMTGECILACFHPEDARQASKDLDGQSFRNSLISVRVL